MQKRLMRQRLSGGLISEILSDPAGHFRDGARRFGDCAFEPTGC
ncbi:Uncharacterised protein [Mycobacteroides abscessus subsp. abscessus]|nr:Uncharacterised protein [Mycobacteroides abscessus subsp. abscessus]